MGDFFSSEDGQCFDDMNAMLWQLYFNVAMKPDLEDGDDGGPFFSVLTSCLRRLIVHGSCLTT